MWSDSSICIVDSNIFAATPYNNIITMQEGLHPEGVAPISY